VLHVPYTYFPDAAGGTEVYVRNLAHALATFGYGSCVAAPGQENQHYEHDGLPIYRFRCDDRQRLELAYGVADDIAAHNFRNIVNALRPAIVHLHARTSAVSERLCDFAHYAGARVVFTYHTPTVSCARGTLMLFGNEPCDGVVQRRRCTSCTLAAHGVPRVLSALAASIPDRLAASLAALGKAAKPAAAIQMSALLGQGSVRFHAFTARVDHVVVPCLWARDVLARNGVPDAKITLSRQGLADRRVTAGVATSREEGEPLRMAYFGRIDPAKGADLLVRAVAAIPHAQVTLDLFAILPPGPSAPRTQLESWVARDRRLTLRPPVAPDAVHDIMSGYDLIAIPSRGFETGPLVALEAFAAGVPVLGSDLGGIAESVRNGVDGILVRPDDVDAWAATILRLAGNRTQVRDLRANIRPPRSMDQVAGEMAKIYAKLQQSG
jgi:glycosyltransferase involved in cell wall biosynthesis